MSRLLFVSLLAGLWLSQQVAQCRGLPSGMSRTSQCYYTSTGTTCFTAFTDRNNHTLRGSFKEASDWCKEHVPGSSLIVIDSLESHRTVQGFIGGRVLVNATIFIGAQKLSASESRTWSWVNGHPTIPNDVPDSALGIHNAACVDSNSGRSLVYCIASVWTMLRFICELPGAAITYTNWAGGYPNDSPDRQCICISPRCWSENNRSTCDYDRKWRTCNCNQIYAIVCQKGDISRQTDSATKTTEKPTTTTTSTETPLSSAKSTTAPPFKSTIHSATTNSKTVTDKTYGDVSSEAHSIQSMNQKSPNPNHISASQTTVFPPSSAGLHTGIIVVIILSVVAIFVVVAVIFMIRKRKHDRQNETSPMGNTKQSDAVTSEYATVVLGNRPCEVTTPAGNTIYAEVDMTQRPTPSNNTIYASVQTNSETIDVDKSVVYADLDLQRKY